MSKERNDRICQLYVSGKYTTAAIGKSFNLTPRRVQQLAKAEGLVRTQAESNRLITPLKAKHRIRRNLKRSLDS